MTLFYLAGAIGDVKDDSFRVWRNKITKILNELGVDVLNPLDKYEGKEADQKDKLDVLRDHGDYSSVREEMFDILRLDKEMVRRSDGVIAYIPADMGYTVGTVREIALAYEWFKPVIVITDIPRLSNSLVGMASHICGSLDEAVEIIRKFYRNKRALRAYVYRDNDLEPTGPTQVEIKKIVRAYLKRTGKDTFTKREISQSPEMERFMGDKRYKSISGYESKINYMAKKGYFDIVR